MRIDINNFDSQTIAIMPGSRESQDETKTLTRVSACGCDTDHHNGEWIQTKYKGKIIYFCAENCKEEFLEGPEAFLDSDHFVLDFELLEDSELTSS